MVVIHHARIFIMNDDGGGGSNGLVLTNLYFFQIQKELLLTVVANYQAIDMNYFIT